MDRDGTVTAVVVLTVIGTLLLSGCGSSKNAALTRYVKQVNDVTSGLKAPLGQVEAVNHRFATRASFTVLTPQLAKARRTLRTLAAQLGALEPPPEAKPLATTLRKLVALEVSLTGEMYRFTVFLPAYRAALVPSDKASRTFQASARAAKTATAEAVVVDAYGASLAKPIAALAKLHPPAVLLPTYAAELHALQSSRQTALALGAALHLKQAQRAHALVVRLAKIGVSTGSIATQRAEIAAVRAYDARVAQVTQLEARAQRQLAALQGH